VHETGLIRSFLTTAAIRPRRKIPIYTLVDKNRQLHNVLNAVEFNVRISQKLSRDL